MNARWTLLALALAGTLVPSIYAAAPVIRPLAQPAPQYPYHLRNTTGSADVVVAFVIKPDGAVDRVGIVSSTDVRFNLAAAEAVRNWRFAPILRDGKPAALRMAVPIAFRITGRAERLPVPADERPVGALPESWPQRTDDLASDPTVRWGRLENGLRYAIRKNGRPGDRVTFRLLVLAGTAHERPDERGFAHFVEHMAFNGTRGHPGETLVPKLQARGLQIGADISAFTFPTFTVFGLDATSTNEAEIRDTLSILRDFADGILFEATQVTKERAVIEAEFRERDSQERRAGEARQTFLLAHSALAGAYVPPMRTDLDRATPESLQRFYRRWYLSRNMIVIAVGDAEVAELEQRISEAFGSMVDHGHPPPSPALGALTLPQPSAAVHTVSAGGVALEWLLLEARQADSLAERKRALALAAVFRAIESRLGRAVSEGGGVYSTATARMTRGPTPVIEYGLAIQSRAAVWHHALGVLVDTVRSVETQGMTPEEFEVSRETFLKAAEVAARGAASLESPAAADRLVGLVTAGWTALSAEEEGALMKRLLGELDASQCTEAFRRLVRSGPPRLFVMAPPLPGLSEGGVLRLHHRLAQLPAAGRAGSSLKPFAYAADQPPGAIRHREHLPAVDITTVEFANGVRANLKPTTFEANSVALRVRWGTGLAGAAPEQLPATHLLGATLLAGGLGRHSADELDEVLAGSAVLLSFSAGEAKFELAGSSDRSGLERLLELTHAYLTDPGWRSQDVDRVQLTLASSLAREDGSVESALGMRLLGALTGGDARYAPPSADGIIGVTRTALLDRAQAVLHEGPLEIGLVGDFDLEQAIGTLARTLGRLPRATQPQDVRKVNFLDTLPATTVTAGGRVDRALLQFAWKLDGCDDLRRWRALQLLSDAVENRLLLRIRELLGAAYAPSATLWQSEAQPADGYLFASIPVDPGRAEELRQEVRSIVSDLRRNGIREDEFARLREPVLRKLAEQLTSNDYWIRYVVPRIGSEPERAEWPLTRRRDLDATTAAELSALAREMLTDERRSEFLARP